MKVQTLGKSVAVLAALALAVGGTVVSANAATPAYIDCQNFSAGEPDHIDPALTSTLVGANTATMLFDGLTDTDANGNLYGEVASKWTTKDGAKTWVFTFKKGLKFSNGEAVLPSSFVNGWKRALDSKLASEVAYHGDFIAGMNAYSTAYSATNEVTGTNYTAGGGTLTRTGVGTTNSTTTNGTGFTDFTDLTFTNATVTARGALIYNNTPSANSNANTTLVNAAVCVLDFGSDKTSTAGDFTIIFPAFDAANAIIRIGQA